MKQKGPPRSASPAAARGPTPPLESTRRLTAARSHEAVEKGRGSDKECMMVVSDLLKGHLALGSASPGMQRLAFKSSPSPPAPPPKIWLFLEKNSTPYTRLERLAGDVTSIIYSLLRQRHGAALLTVSPSLQMKCCFFSDCDAASPRVWAASSSAAYHAYCASACGLWLTSIQAAGVFCMKLRFGNSQTVLLLLLLAGWPTFFPRPRRYAIMF